MVATGPDFQVHFSRRVGYRTTGTFDSIRQDRVRLTFRTPQLYFKGADATESVSSFSVPRHAYGPPLRFVAAAVSVTCPEIIHFGQSRRCSTCYSSFAHHEAPRLHLRLAGRPLALKARLLALLRNRPVELCGAPIFDSRVTSLTPRQRELIQRRLSAAGKAAQAAQVMEAAEAARARDLTGRATSHPAYASCNRPRGHKGPHMFLNKLLERPVSR